MLAIAGSAVLTPADARPRAALGTLIPAHPGQVLPTRNSSVTSLNWSGYAVVQSNISSVHSTFTVPAVDDTTPGFAATWAGIGGYNTGDLIQAGVEEDAPSAALGYTAWYEILPAAETPLSGCSGDTSCTVHPGDQMTVDITATSPGSNNWTVSMSDSGHWSFSKSVPYTSSHSSAEWILEAPTLLVAQTALPMMQNAQFGSGDTFSVGGGASQTVAGGNPVSINMAAVEAVPSPLRADGSSFTVCPYALSCP